jgi:hypothetical protein
MRGANLHSYILVTDVVLDHRYNFFIKYHIMKSVQVQVHSFFTSAVGRCKWLSSRPGRPTPRGIAASTIRQVARLNQQDIWVLSGLCGEEENFTLAGA